MRAMVCLSCQYYGRPAKRARGSNGLARAAWLVFPLGLPYTFWRMLTKRTVCKQCGAAHLASEDSVAGQRVLSEIFGLGSEDRAAPAGGKMDDGFAVFMAEKEAQQAAPPVVAVKPVVNPDEW